MNQTIYLESPDQESKVWIDGGELIGYKKNGDELIHQKGAPGWRNADTEMFPVIGPTVQNNFEIPSPKGVSFQDQHGLLRELPYTLVNFDDTAAVYIKKYTAHTAVKNSKYPEKSSLEMVSWPYDFTFSKSFLLTDDFLRIEFEIIAEAGMPFMLGYHPAFKLKGFYEEKVHWKNESISLPKIIKGGSKAFPVLDVQEIILYKNEGNHIKIETEGFDHFMLWTEVPNMLCIEPITHYPYADSRHFPESMFKRSNGKDYFSVKIQPFLHR